MAKLLKLDNLGYPTEHSETSDSIVLNKIDGSPSSPAYTIDDSTSNVVLSVKDGSNISQPSNPVNTNQAVNKGYGDVTIDEAQVVTLISGEPLHVGDAVYIKESDSRAWRTNASNLSSSEFVGIVTENQLTEGASIKVRVSGTETSNSTLVQGQKLFLSSSIPGGYTSDIPSGSENVVYRLGYANSTSDIVLDPELTAIRETQVFSTLAMFFDGVDDRIDINPNVVPSTIGQRGSGVCRVRMPLSLNTQNTILCIAESGENIYKYIYYL